MRNVIFSYFCPRCLTVNYVKPVLTIELQAPVELTDTLPSLLAFKSRSKESPTCLGKLHSLLSSDVVLTCHVLPSNRFFGLSPVQCCWWSGPYNRAFEITLIDWQLTIHLFSIIEPWNEWNTKNALTSNRKVTNELHLRTWLVRALWLIVFASMLMLQKLSWWFCWLFKWGSFLREKTLMNYTPLPDFIFAPIIIAMAVSGHQTMKRNQTKPFAWTTYGLVFYSKTVSLDANL